MRQHEVMISLHADGNATNIIQLHGNRGKTFLFPNPNKTQNVFVYFITTQQCQLNQFMSRYSLLIGQRLFVSVCLHHVSCVSICVCGCVQALELIGLKPSDTQWQTLRSRLRADPAGTVAFTGKTSSLSSPVAVLLQVSLILTPVQDIMYFYLYLALVSFHD